MPACCKGVHMTCCDGAQQGGVIGLPDRELAFIPDGGGRCPRADALRQYAIQPPMHEPEGLPMVLLHLEPTTGCLSIGIEPLGADQLVEVAHGLAGVHCASRLA